MTEEQAGRVWEKMLEAEVRSLYFADMASQNTKRKHWIVGLSFVTSSGAAVTFFGDPANWMPAMLGFFVALLNGSAIAVNLDQRALVLSKLHASWNDQQNRHERVRDRWHEADADATYETLLRRAGELSEEGSIEPWKPKVMVRREKFVYSRLKAEVAQCQFQDP